jgi:hypothetical protein
VTFDRPGVRVHRPPLDQPASFERVDDPGDPAEAQAARTRQPRQAQALSLRQAQPVQRLERAQRQPMLRLEFGVELASQPLVGLEQADPSLGVRFRPAGQAILTNVKAWFRGGFVARD